MSTISTQLKRLREQAELSQRQLARNSGVSVGFISKLEAGKYKTMSLAKSQQLAQGLGLDLHDFLSGLGFFTSGPAATLSRKTPLIHQHNDLLHLSKAEKEALAKFKGELQRAFPRQDPRLRLFGSKARGDARKYSDIDVLIVLSNRRWETRRRVHQIAGQISRQTGTDLSVKIITPSLDRHLRRHGSPLIANIDREGFNV